MTQKGWFGYDNFVMDKERQKQMLLLYFEQGWVEALVDYIILQLGWGLSCLFILGAEDAMWMLLLTMQWSDGELSGWGGRQGCCSLDLVFPRHPWILKKFQINFQMTKIETNSQIIFSRVRLQCLRLGTTVLLSNRQRQQLMNVGMVVN